MSRFRVAPASAWIAILLAGCSAARYDADYAKAVEKYREAAPFAVLQPESAESTAGRITARLPEGFVAVAAEPPAVEGAAAVEPVHPSRILPDFLADFPGHEATFERRLMHENEELPVSVAVWSLEGSGTKAKLQKLEKTLLDRARGSGSFKDVPQAWEDREVRPVAGGPAAWRVLSLRGRQVFESSVPGSPKLHNPWDSTCEFWLTAEPVEDARALLVWRVPEKLVGTLPVPPAQLAETVARTVRIHPPEPGSERPPAGNAKPADDAGAPPTPAAPF